MRVSALIFTLLCTSCEMRTSSEERFETNVGFRLPSDKTILKDEYEDMLQDYAIIYEVELSEESNQQLASKLRTQIGSKDQHCAWSLSNNGFYFRCEKGLTIYTVSYDTMSRKLTYNEAAD